MAGFRLLAKRTLSVPARWTRFARSVPTRWVLTFHEVGDHRWATPPDRFAAILEAVAANAEVVSLARLVDEPPSERLRVALAFDDGYVGVVERALPVLERLRMPATVFLPTDLLADEDALPRADRGLYEGLPLLGWRTVRRVAAAGTLAFESHGATHRRLDIVPEPERRAELVRSRERIAAEIGRAPRFLAYPFGTLDSALSSAAREAGYYAAFTTRHGGLRASAERFALPRADVRGEYQPSDVLAILRGDWNYLAWTQALAP